MIPAVTQHARYGCGIACLISALDFFDKPTPSETALRTHLAVDPAVGAEPSQLIAGAERYGLTGEARVGADLAELVRQRTAGAFVILLLQAFDSPAEGDTEGHWCALDGAEGDVITLMDPAGGEMRRVPVAEFQRRFHGMWEGGQVVQGGAVVIRQKTDRKDRKMGERVQRFGETMSLREDGDRKDVAALSAAEIVAQAKEGEIPRTVTATINGPNGPAKLTVPVPEMFLPPEADEHASPSEKMNRRKCEAFRPPTPRDHRAARTPRSR